MLSNYFSGTPPESSSVFSKSGENFNPKQLTMFAENNFTESFTPDVLQEFSKMSKTISTALSVGEFINYY